MQERRATVDGKPMPLGESFFVIATQNPLEFEGTYPLPESQLDRFMLKVLIPYPDEEAELRVLRQHHEGFRMSEERLAGVGQVAGDEDIRLVWEAASAVRVHPEVMRYVARVARQTRNMPSLMLGASPRAAADLLTAAKTLAMFRGRDYLTPDDVKRMEAELEARTVDDVLREVFRSVDVPRMDHADA